MKVAFITRSTIYNVPGGDTVQITETAKNLRQLDTGVDIYPTNKKINYSQYDLFHFFNLSRPADILFHIRKIKAPAVLSPILVDYSEYDKQERKGLTGFIFRMFSANTNEYIKTISRAVKGNDSLPTAAYIRKGHRKSIIEILKKTSLLLPNSELEYQNLEKKYGVQKGHVVVPNGIDPLLFQPGEKKEKDNKLIVCIARIEGIKNQLNLIRAVNDTAYTLMIIGSPAPNQQNYYRQCRKSASSNIRFIDRLPQNELINYYKTAKVHVLPSWFETCGLSSLEAGAMGCNLVITDKGYTREYFGEDAFYCNPADPVSILDVIEKASGSECRVQLQQKILNKYTWQIAAAVTLDAYKKAITVEKT